MRMSFFGSAKVFDQRFERLPADANWSRAPLTKSFGFGQSRRNSKL